MLLWDDYYRYFSVTFCEISLCMNLVAQSKSSYSQLGSEQEGHTCQLTEWVHLWSPACFAENQGGSGNRDLRPLFVWRLAWLETLPGFHQSGH